MPATITPLVSNVGNKTGRDIINYTVAAQAGTYIDQIEEQVAGKTTNVYTDPASLSRTFTIPQAQFDALRFYQSHTALVIVTDSTGQQTRATYTFTKSLATNESVLPAVKAVADGVFRTSQKRASISALVGLGANGTFDQIIDQLTNGNGIRRFASGTVTSSISTLNMTTLANGTVSTPTVTVSGIRFTPSVVIVYNGAKQASSVNTRAAKDSGDTIVTTQLYTGDILFIRLKGNAYIETTGFRLPVPQLDANYYWEAYS